MIVGSIAPRVRARAEVHRGAFAQAIVGLAFAHGGDALAISCAGAALAIIPVERG